MTGPRVGLGSLTVWDGGGIGDYTGCSTPRLLEDAGVAWVRLGDPSRAESAEMVAKKAALALEAGLGVCC